MSTYLIMMIAAIIWFVILPTLKASTYRVWRVFIAPMMFIYLLFIGIQRDFVLKQDSIYLIVGALILGIVIGVILRKNSVIQVDKTKGLIHVPGSYYALLTFCFIFVVHFMIGYLQSVAPEILKDADMAQMLIFSLALVSGMPAGQAICLFIKYNQTKHLGVNYAIS